MLLIERLNSPLQVHRLRGVPRVGFQFLVRLMICGKTDYSIDSGQGKYITVSFAVSLSSSRTERGLGNCFESATGETGAAVMELAVNEQGLG